MSDDSHSNFASFDWRDILHTEVSFTGIGILKCEWAVQPPSNNSAAIPDDATANAIFPIPLTVDNNASIRNVLP